MTPPLALATLADALHISIDSWPERSMAILDIAQRASAS